MFNLLLKNISARRRPLLVFFAGCLTTLAMPPFGFSPILLLTIPLFLLLSKSAATKKQCFLKGWFFGAGFFITSLYWISAALLVDVVQWGWVFPLSLIVGPSLLGLFWSIMPVVCHRIRHNHISVYSIFFILIWMIVEYGRGHLFTGFPWNLIGYTWDPVLPIAQANAVIGINGLYLLTLLWAATPLFFQRRILTTISVMSFILVAVFGFMRLETTPTVQNGDHVIRIVQPNIPQNEKWVPGKEQEHFDKQLALTRTPAKDNLIPTFIVWPETAVGADLRLHPQLAETIAQNMPPNAHAVLGSLRMTQKTDDSYNYFNSVTIINDQGAVTGVYDKHHLVPFGEYIPYRNILNVTPLATAISGIGDFTKGTGVTTLSPDTLGELPKLSPLICYEAIFPRAVVKQNDRPDWMVNVTNDGWYGKTTGPYQHLAITRVRAIEEGIPLIRAANTGISAIIDPVGRVIAREGLEEEGIVDGILPRPLPPTIYGQYGDIPFFLLILLLAIPFIRTASFSNKSSD